MYEFYKIPKCVIKSVYKLSDNFIYCVYIYDEIPHIDAQFTSIKQKLSTLSTKLSTIYKSYPHSYPQFPIYSLGLSTSTFVSRETFSPSNLFFSTSTSLTYSVFSIIVSLLIAPISCNAFKLAIISVEATGIDTL